MSNRLLARDTFLNQIALVYASHAICALIGPRQCGKTTLARLFSEVGGGVTHWFDLEDITDLEKLQTPRLALDHLEGLIIIDEIQRRPDLFPYLRVLADKYPHRRYLILGSASRELIKQSPETLAGRIAYIEITPFRYSEVHELQQLLYRGGFPKSYLATTQQNSHFWRKQYLTSFIEKELPDFGVTLAPIEVRRFLMMLVHYHGNIINYSDLGRSLGISDQTVRRYCHLMTGIFWIRQLAPWFENISKRQVKSPKIYWRDSGLLLSLLGLQDDDILGHPKAGAIWEGFALEEIIRFHQLEATETFFWSAISAEELDLLMVRGSDKIGVEFKFSDQPKVTKSMHQTLNLLQLHTLYVIIPIRADYRLTEKIHVMGLQDYLEHCHEAIDRS